MNKTMRMLVLLAIMVAVLPMFACATILQAIAPTPTPTPTPLPTPTPTPEPTVELIENLDSYLTGYIGNDGGYYSFTFDFGIELPSDWTVYNRAMMNEYNSISLDTDDPVAIKDTYISALRQGKVLMEYFAFKDDPSEMFFVFVTDTTRPDGRQYSELGMLDQIKYWFLDFDSDQIIDVKNLQLTVTDILDEEHPVYRFDDSDGVSKRSGAIFAIKRGTMFEVIEVTSEQEDRIDEILQCLYN